MWTALSDTEVAKHVLKYHFLTVENKNDLYECWIFCKILDAVSDTYMLKFKEGSRSDGIATFQTSDGSLKITYQKRYGTGWIDEGKWVEDRPDLAIEYKNGYSIILDAKNSDYNRSGPYSYREQMDSYMNSAKATYGILIFSLANPGLWKEIIKNDTQKIIWTHLTPSVGVTIEDTASTANLRKIMDLLKPPTVR